MTYDAKAAAVEAALLDNIQILALEERRKELEAAGLMPLRKIWVCDVSWEGDTDVFISWTNAGIVRQLREWAKAHWGELSDDANMAKESVFPREYPTDVDDEAFLEFLDAHERCWLSINLTEIK